MLEYLLVIGRTTRRLVNRITKELMYIFVVLLTGLVKLG